MRGSRGGGRQVICYSQLEYEGHEKGGVYDYCTIDEASGWSNGKLLHCMVISEHYKEFGQ